MWRQIFAIATLSRSLALAQSQPPASCPVTDASAQPFVPPAASPHQPSPDRFLFGTERLWTELPLSGIYPTVEQKDGYFTKHPWFSSSFNLRTVDERQSHPEPKLTITKRLLDSVDKSADVPPQTGNASFMENGGAFYMSGPTFPTLGCWEVTGQIEDTKLTFVLWVVN